VHVNHIGLCVSDVDRSMRFYTELLGFTFERELRPPDSATSALLGLPPPLGMRAVYLRLGPVVLELLAYGRPGGTAPWRERTMDEPGLTHLSFGVDDYSAALGRVEELGGTLIPSSDIGVAAMVRDPDGQLIEILPGTWGHDV
jgi:catechol 2,3-dioxygenase-like lactoylglutathione lyase family enzyme